MLPSCGAHGAAAHDSSTPTSPVAQQTIFAPTTTFPPRLLGIARKRTVRAKSPVIPQRLLRPHLWPLRAVLVPWPRIEISERFVLHLIHFAEQFDADIVACAMIGCHVVADDMATGSPDKTQVVLGEEVAGAMNLRPILDLEGNVMELRGWIDHEVDAVMIDGTTQECKGVVAPVGHSESEDIGVELDDLLDVGDAMRHMTELQRRDDGLLAIVLGKDIVGVELDQCALDILEHNGLRDTGRNAIARLAVDAMLGKFFGDLTEIAARRHLKGQPRQVGAVAALESDRFEAGLGCQEGAIAVP